MGNKWADIVTSLPGRYVDSCELVNVLGQPG
jgi:hypothetical protein